MVPLLQVDARQKRQERGEAEAIKTRSRQGRGERSKGRREAEAKAEAKAKASLGWPRLTYEMAVIISATFIEVWVVIIYYERSW